MRVTSHVHVHVAHYMKIIELIIFVKLLRSRFIQICPSTKTFEDIDLMKIGPNAQQPLEEGNTHECSPQEKDKIL